LTSKPMFFCPGGESDVYGGYNHNGFMFQYGAHLGAFQLFPEHRFYGQSLPFGPVDSYTPDNINKLTIEQALQDYVEIIQYVMHEFGLPQDIPIITFGGSYPGELAAFLRIAFPNVVDGALASSAPVRYHPFLPGGTNSGAFYRVVTKDFAMEDHTCPDKVRTAFAQMISAFESSSGRDQIVEDLRLCSPLDDTADQLRLVNLWMENAFASLGMENYPYAIGDLPAFPLKNACAVFNQNLKETGNYVESLGQAVGAWYNSSGTLTCFNISAEYYPCADITGCGGGVGDPDAMSWDYQSCTEIIADVDTNNVTDMFPPAPYDFSSLSAYCHQQWGVQPDPLKIPFKYSYANATRIIFSNGFLDPWWPGGVLQSANDEIIPLQMAQAAHHLDLRGSSPSDPADVTATRLQEAQIINGWLSQVSQDATRAARMVHRFASINE